MNINRSSIIYYHTIPCDTLSSLCYEPRRHYPLRSRKTMSFGEGHYYKDTNICIYIHRTEGRAWEITWLYWGHPCRMCVHYTRIYGNTTFNGMFRIFHQPHSLDAHKPICIHSRLLCVYAFRLDFWLIHSREIV